MKYEMDVSDKWTRLVVVQETCAQLQSLTGEGFGDRKELIDPDGQSIGHNPIEVRDHSKMMSNFFESFLTPLAPLIRFLPYIIQFF